MVLEYLEAKLPNKPEIAEQFLSSCPETFHTANEDWLSATSYKLGESFWHFSDNPAFWDDLDELIWDGGEDVKNHLSETVAWFNKLLHKVVLTLKIPPIFRWFLSITEMPCISGNSKISDFRVNKFHLEHQSVDWWNIVVLMKRIKHNWYQFMFT